MKINSLLIGLGEIGYKYDINNLQNKNYYSHAKSLNNHDRFYFSGAVDINKNNIDDFKKYYSCPTFDDLSKAMQLLKPEFIIIATPSNTHHKVIDEVIKYKSVKIILCEKPLDIEYEKTVRLINKCKKNNVNLFVNYMRRCDPAIIKIKELILKKEIKPPFVGHAFYSGGLINNGSHLFNLFEFLLGKFKKYELLRNYNQKSNSPNFLSFFDYGHVVFQSLDDFQYSEISFELNCINGKLKFENFGWDIKWFPVVGDKEFENYKIIDKNFINVETQMYKYQLNVLNMISDEFIQNKTTLCTGEQALVTMKTLNLLNKDYLN